ncbi:MAG TPA: DUF2203 domain-containing protein [bacterium]|jgi:hypothetical protein
MDGRFVSLEQVTRVLPDVERLLLQLREIRDQGQQTRERLELLWAALERGDAVLDEIGALQRQLDERAEEFGALAARLEELGGVLKDLDMGLVDFPTVAGGSEVYLCWRLGEDGISYWHGLDEGYAGRKPLWTLPGSHPHLA